jgi:hypothetical protein
MVYNHLTRIDDGPTVDGSFGTTQLVEKLAETRAKATFYIVGSNAIQHPNVLKAVDAAGHELALHSWTHHPLTSLTNEQIVAERMCRFFFNSSSQVQSSGNIFGYWKSRASYASSLWRH